jgi:SPP1 gp7 family putative phage head morphogenesis protein
MAERLTDPLVVIRAREFKRQLLAREDAQMSQMAQRWLQVEQALQAEIDALIYEVRELRQAGERVTQGKLWRIQRYRNLLRQAEAEFDRYADYAADLIRTQQERLVRLGVEHATQTIQLSYWQYGIIDASFQRLPVRAVEYLVGLAGNGQPVGELLKARMVRDADGNPIPGVWDRLTRSLITGTARGMNPRLIARAMRDDLAGGLNKAMVIARTEELRPYRQAGTDAYAESGVVEGHKRLTAHDRRVCPACIADEGTVYPVGTPIGDHPQGRCSSVPVLIDVPEPTWVSGEAWFSRQSRKIQLSILGQGRLDAWEDGTFDFGDLTIKTFDETWGESLNPAPLYQLVGGAG